MLADVALLGLSMMRSTAWAQVTPDMAMDPELMAIVQEVSSAVPPCAVSYFPPRPVIIIATKASRARFPAD